MVGVVIVGVETGFDNAGIVAVGAGCVRLALATCGAFLVPATAVVRGVLFVTVVVVTANGVEMFRVGLGTAIIGVGAVVLKVVVEADAATGAKVDVIATEVFVTAFIGEASRLDWGLLDDEDEEELIMRADI